MAKSDGVVRAEVSFRCSSGVFVQRHQEFASDDPVVKARPHLFSPVAAEARTTAAVPGPVVSPPPAPVVERPAANDTKDQWRAYVEALGGSPGELTKAELVDLADELEG